MPGKKPERPSANVEGAADRVVATALLRRDAAASNPQHEAMSDDDRRLRDVWDEVGALGYSDNYSALLGSPTWRERWVAMRQSVPEIWADLSQGASRMVIPATAGVAALAVACGIFMVAQPPEQLHFSADREAQAVTLPDGSSVVLGPTSAFVFERSGGRRIARLTGEAEFEVAPDAAHPFIVEAGESRVRVVGTRFTLSHRESCTQLLVHAGIVQFAAPGASPRQLRAGEEAAAIDDSQPLSHCLGIADAMPLRWSYIDAPLSTIMADIAPFHPHKIVLRSADIGGERVTLSFHAEEIGHVIDLLPTVLDVQIDEGADGTIFIGR